MNIFYIYAHPNPTSFNGVLKEVGYKILQQAKHEVIVSDLYAERFNAIASNDDFNLPEADLNPQYFIAQKIAYDQNALASDIKVEIDKISWADHLIFQFPLWWFSTPAILKGWLDRVLVKGFAYDAGKVLAQGLLKGKTASLVLSTQSPASAYQLDGLHQAPINYFLHHIHHTLHFVGIKTLTPFVIYAAFNLDLARQQEIINDYQVYLHNILQK